MVEYLLIVAVVVTIFLAVARPYFKKMQTKIGTSFKEGIMGERANLYYYPVKQRQ